MHTHDGTNLLGMRGRDASGAQLARPTRLADPFGGGPSLARGIGDVDVATKADDIAEAEISEMGEQFVIAEAAVGQDGDTATGRDEL
jgi:hypothetical protein